MSIKPSYKYIITSTFPRSPQAPNMFPGSSTAMVVLVEKGLAIREGFLEEVTMVSSRHMI